jgi:PadR family transcriptional regulator, regulatory protein PadR
MHRETGLKKELVAASTEPLILAILAKGESYGYAIIQEITARSNNRLEWTDGMLYPVLHRMERKGWIRSRWSESETGRKRKYYAICRAGKTALSKHRADWGVISDVFAGITTRSHV